MGCGITDFASFQLKPLKLKPGVFNDVFADSFNCFYANLWVEGEVDLLQVEGYLFHHPQDLVCREVVPPEDQFLEGDCFLDTVAESVEVGVS